MAILLVNCPQFLIAQLGVWKAGAIAALINPQYTGAELEHMLGECGASTTVVLSRYYDKVRSCQGHEGRIIAANVKDFLPAHPTTLVADNSLGHAQPPEDLVLL